MCATRGTGTNLIAALDSNAAEVRQMSNEVETRAGWDSNLPTPPDAYVALCIYDVTGLTPYPEGTNYMAQWAILQGNGILTIW